jgi:MFS family permease
VLIDIIACDLFPLRDRGKWLGIINAWAGLAAALGPVLGGVLGQNAWRWIFYLKYVRCSLPARATGIPSMPLDLLVDGC